MEARRRRCVQCAYRLPFRVLNRDVHVSGGGGFQVVVDVRAVRRILARGWIVVRRRGCRDRTKAVRRTRREQVRVGVEHLRRHLAQGGDVVEDPDAATVRRDHQIVELLLHHEPVHRCVRQVHLQRLPVLAIVERHVGAVLGAEIEQPALDRIFAHAMRVAQHRVRDAVRDQFPRCAEISRLVDEGISVVHLMKLDRDVCRAGVVARRLDVADASPWR